MVDVQESLQRAVAEGDQNAIAAADASAKSVRDALKELAEADAESQLRPTADIGVGLRGIGVGRIDVTAEVRYLLSTFDQSKLPTRGIAPQNQRQNDLVLSIGFGIRP